MKIAITGKGGVGKDNFFLNDYQECLQMKDIE